MTWDGAPYADGPDPAPRFQSFAEQMVGEREDRLEQAKCILTFGVRFLDVALGGIFPRDLVLIGAKMGKGKTALATIAAFANARSGRRVHYFALEAERKEIERRIKFQLVSEAARASLSYSSLAKFNYLDWYTGKIDDIAYPFEKQAEEKLSVVFKTLFTFYRERDFYAEHFEAMVKAVQNETDLIVLDHLHYVDTEDPSENRGLKLITKKIRDVVLTYGKPTLVVAHVRKGDRRLPQLVPTEEDFHGTSDIGKIATKAITFAPAFDQPSDDPTLWPTYMWPVKCRADGQRTRYVGMCIFDARLGKYQDEFLLGQLTPSGDEFKTTEWAKWPEWAKADRSTK